MLNFDTFTKINPDFFPKKKVKSKSKKTKFLSVHKDTADKVKSVLSKNKRMTFKDVSLITGLSRSTVSRASKYLCGIGAAVISVDQNGQARSSYLQLV